MGLYRILPILLLALAALAWPPAPAQGGEPPRVAVSLPPLHALVTAVMEGVGAPDLLIEGGASPHRTALRPSAARKLARAEIVFWVGPELETFLEGVFGNLGPEARTVALLHAPGMTRIARREAPERGHAHAEPDGDDPHFWLDPENAIRVTAIAAETLIAADPERAGAYRANQARAAARLRALDGEMEAALRPLGGRPFLVFHDSYAYLERRYGLGPAIAIAIDAERSPGARRLLEIRERIEAHAVGCLFREPQFPSPIVERLREGTDLRVDVLDPLGSDLEPGASLYEKMMRALTARLVRCLESAKDS
ncbi:MAG: zinc ABC transporter substrate-binding protein [Alphaproteobacteria bacterium]|nr:zinc ABC transporter substrate-binding protein [Alphaproteobacteria bacterium]